MRAAKLARGCYKKKNTRPDSGDCRNVTATAPHCCARLVEDGRIFAVDAQYLQFVPPEETGSNFVHEGN